MTDQISNAPTLTEKARILVESDRTQFFITAVIVANAIIIGLETWSAAMEVAGGLLWALDRIALSIFVLELSLKLFVYRAGFFRSGWNVFDFVIVAAALIPASEATSVLRALRIVRAMRLLSVVPKIRQVVQGLLGAIPAMGSVIVLLTLVFYVFSVMATKLFGQTFPDWFGTIGASLYTLFQIMTLESWSMGIVRPVMESYPLAWVFFVPFILVTSFIVLNLFIAIIVNAMHDVAEADRAEEKAIAATPDSDADADIGASAGAGIATELSALRAEIAQLRAELKAKD